MSIYTEKMKAEIAKRDEFLDNRISWKFLEKKIEPDLRSVTRLLLEILKELQYLNDK